MADAIHLYLPADSGLLIAEILQGHGLDVKTKLRKLSDGTNGPDYLVSRGGDRMSILEVPGPSKLPRRFLLCLAPRKRIAFLREVAGILKANGAKSEAE